RTDVQHEFAVQFAGSAQRHVDLLGVQPCAGCAHGVAAADVLTVDAPQVHRDARHRAHLRLVPAQRLQTADGDAPPGVFEFVADADSARGQGAGDDGASTAD